ncbi:MAG: ABC transporter permease [Bacteroidales bacterium]|nr:ABC transporter permease [Bacteroidales bacterium]
MLKSIIKSIQVISFTFSNELKRIFTDTGALLILLGAAVIYPLAYSVAYKNNVLEEIPIGIVDLDNTVASHQLEKMINSSEKVSFYSAYENLEEAKTDLWNKKINGVVLISKGFETQLSKGEQATISLYSDAGYFLIYKETLTGVLQSTSMFSAGIEIKKLMAKGSSQEQALMKRQPINSSFYNLYNPSSSYGPYVMPGILLIILQQTLLVGIGMVNGTDREKRNNKIVFPGMMKQRGVYSIIIGKSLAYFFTSIFSFSFALIWVHKWFTYPSKEAFVDLLVFLVPFIFATIFLGLAISLIFQKREHSVMFLVFLSPIVLFLSGISWPAALIPKPLYFLAHIFPGTKMAPAYLRLRTMGVDLSDVRSELIFLIVQMVIYFFIAAAAYKFAINKQKNKQENRA